MALDHDGVDDFVSHGDITGISGATVLTVMLWLFYDVAAASDGFSIKDSGAGQVPYYIATRASDNSAMVFLTGDPGITERSYTATGQVATGVWAHWALVVNTAGAAGNDRVKIYKDGTNLTLTHASASPNPLPSGAAANVVTMRHVNTGSYSDGRLAYHKIWLAELSAAEVYQEMNSHRPVRTANLVLCSPYDDDTNARDYSGNGNHGTVTGTLQAAGPPVGYGASVLGG